MNLRMYQMRVMGWRMALRWWWKEWKKRGMSHDTREAVMGIFLILVIFVFGVLTGCVLTTLSYGA